MSEKAKRPETKKQNIEFTLNQHKAIQERADLFYGGNFSATVRIMCAEYLRESQ